MNNKLKNAFVGAAFAASLSACKVITHIPNQDVEPEPLPPPPAEPLITKYYDIELRDKITLFTSEKFMNDLRETESIITQSPNDNYQHIINVTINSPGGHVNEGYRLLDAFEKSSNNFNFKCEEQASSMAAIVFIGATGKNRDAEQDCTIMIHQSYFTIYEPRDSFNFITTTEYNALKPQYELAKNDPNIQSVVIKQPGAPDYKLSRAEILNWFERLHKYRETVKERLSETTFLNPNDIEIILDNGNNYFSVESAAFAGMIDTINGTPPTSEHLQQGEILFCNNLPTLSLCA